MSDDIFDLKKTDDLPPNLRKISFGISDDTFRLLTLFDIKENLSIPEVMVGMYRKYNKSVTRHWATATLHNISRSGLIKRISRGCYEKVRKKND